MSSIKPNIGIMNLRYVWFKHTLLKKNIKRFERRKCGFFQSGSERIVGAFFRMIMEKVFLGGGETRKPPCGGKPRKA